MSRLGIKAALLLTASLTCAPIGRTQVQQLPPGTSSPVEDLAAKTVDADMAVLQHAEARMAAQDWAGAMVLLGPLIDRKPANAQALYDLGFCEDALNHVVEATSAYRRAIAADPQNVLPGVGLGLLLARNGDGPGAMAALQQATSLPGDRSPATAAAKAQAYRAMARLDLGSAPDRSREDLLQALRLSPETPDDIQLAGEIAEASHDDTEAETAYARVHRATPDDPQAAVQYARVLGRRANVDQAIAVLDSALAAHPGNTPLLSEKAAVLLQGQRVAEAVPLLRQLHTTHPEDDAVTRLLARAYVSQGAFASADPLFGHLSAADAQSGDLLAEWADSLIRQKRDAEAQALLERALTASFATPAAKAKAASELAFAASANHQPQTVVRAVLIRNSITPPDASSTFLLATAHDNLHESREAAGMYRQFLELAKGQFPDEEAQATERLQVLRRAK